MVRFISRYFILFDAVVNGIIFLIFLSSWITEHLPSRLQILWLRVDQLSLNRTEYHGIDGDSGWFGSQAKEYTGKLFVFNTT